MDMLSRNGAQYRTKLMEKPAAQAFQRCLSKNPAFAYVTVEQSPRAKGAAAFFVVFEPSSLEKRRALLDRHQDQREGRAEAEGNDYLWVENPENNSWWVMSLSGNTYEVRHHLGLCSCPDFTFRCAGNGLQCKHLIAFDKALGTFHPAVADAPAFDAANPFGVPTNEWDPEWAEIQAARASEPEHPEEEQFERAIDRARRELFEPAGGWN